MNWSQRRNRQLENNLEDGRTCLRKMVRVISVSYVKEKQPRKGPLLSWHDDQVSDVELLRELVKGREKDWRKKRRSGPWVNSSGLGGHLQRHLKKRDSEKRRGTPPAKNGKKGPNNPVPSPKNEAPAVEGKKRKRSLLLLGGRRKNVAEAR